jgi:putative transposase
MRQKGLLGKRKERVHRTTDSDHDFPRYPNLVMDLQVVRPDLVWVSDITYIRLAHEFVHLAVIMDVFTRNVRGRTFGSRHLGRSLDQSLTLLALQRALAHGKPEIHHSNQGVQYAATTYTRMLQSVHVQISMASAGEAWQNGYAERLLRTIKEEEVDLSEYTNYADALRQLGRFLDDVYTHKRIHSALGYLTPAEFEVQWRCEQAAAHSRNQKLPNAADIVRANGKHKPPRRPMQNPPCYSTNRKCKNAAVPEHRRLGRLDAGLGCLGNTMALHWCVRRKPDVRFGSVGGVGDRPADHNWAATSSYKSRILFPSGSVSGSSFPPQTAVMGGLISTPCAFSSWYVFSRSSQRNTKLTTPSLDLPHFLSSQMMIAGEPSKKPNSTPS